MMNLIRSELLKLKKSWLVALSFIVALVIPVLSLLLSSAEGAQIAGQPQFLILIRQNHIFLTLMVCNLLFSLMATNLFFKEFQYGTIVDIISVPVKRTSYLFTKEFVLLVWMMSVGLISFAFCVIIGAVTGMEGFTAGMVLLGLWRYVVSVLISFIPLQLIIWITLLFKNYVASLAVSIVALVGSVFAYNTKDFIFVYPYSIPFVLTNFQTGVMPNQVMISVISLMICAFIFLPVIFIGFRKKDI